MGEGYGLEAAVLQSCKMLPAVLTYRGVLSGKFAPVLYDYSYFKVRASVDRKVEQSIELQHLENELLTVSLRISYLCWSTAALSYRF